MTRDLASLGHRVVGLDRSAAMVRAAVDGVGEASGRAADDGVALGTGAKASGGAAAPGAPAFLRADVAALPLGDGVADLAVAFMVLQDVDRSAAAAAEAARVLRPGGRLVLAVTHPIQTAGSFDRSVDPPPFVIEGSYLEHRVVDDEMERDGLTMRFVAEHRPLEAYHRYLEGAGLVTETVREIVDPSPTDRWHRIPLFLHLVAVKPPVAARADRRLFHIATPTDVATLRATGELIPRSLTDKGFVHCSTSDQLVATTGRWFDADADAELMLVELDPERLDADVRWPEVYPGQRFPHVHGPIAADAVVAVHPWGRAERAAGPPRR